MDTFTEATRSTLLDLLRRRGIRQAEIAAALGLSQQAVSDRLRGRTRLTLEDLHRLAALLGMDAWELLYPRSAGPLVTTLDGEREVA